MPLTHVHPIGILHQALAFRPDGCDLCGDIADCAENLFERGITLSICLSELRDHAVGFGSFFVQQRREAVAIVIMAGLNQCGQLP